MRKPILLALSSAAIATVAWGGYWLHHQSVCASLEEDYLNTVSHAKSSAQTQALVASLGKSNSSTIFEQSMRMDGEMMGLILTQLNEKCGRRASDTALRKGRELLF